MDVPLTISFKGNSAEFERDLFGLGEKVEDPEILKIVKNAKDLRYVKKSTTIIDGITLDHSQKRQFRQAMESLQPGLENLHYIISIADTMLGLGVNVYAISDWFLNKIRKHDCKISIGNKEVKTADEFQKTLDEYIKNNSRS